MSIFTFNLNFEGIGDLFTPTPDPFSFPTFPFLGAIFIFGLILLIIFIIKNHPYFHKLITVLGLAILLSTSPALATPLSPLRSPYRSEPSTFKFPSTPKFSSASRWKKIAISVSALAAQTATFFGLGELANFLFGPDPEGLGPIFTLISTFSIFVLFVYFLIKIAKKFFHRKKITAQNKQLELVRQAISEITPSGSKTTKF